jgi:hypothetical protein
MTGATLPEFSPMCHSLPRICCNKRFASFALLEIHCNCSTRSDQRARERNFKLSTEPQYVLSSEPQYVDKVVDVLGLYPLLTEQLIRRVVRTSVAASGERRAPV